LNIHRYDALVIGSGLTGGWAAKELSEAGLEVLVLDAGPARLPTEIQAGRATDTEAKNRAAQQQPVQSRHNSYWSTNSDFFVNDVENPYTSSGREPFTWIRGRQLGGRSLTWGGVTLRFSDYEFRAAKTDSFGPCWPLQYDDLAPFYDKVERFLRVCGSRDGLSQLPDGKFEAAPRFTSAELAFSKSVQATWKTRSVVISRGQPLAHDERMNISWPPRVNLCNTLRVAIDTGRTHIRPNAIVSHLLVDSQTRRIKGAACIDRQSRTTFEVDGRVIVLCASTIESIRILLNSRCRQHPDGVGNSSGLLGRFLLDHMTVWIGGTLEPEGGSEPVGGAHGIVIPKFRNVTEWDVGFLRGYGIWGAIGRTVPGNADRGVWFLNSLVEVLPRKENRVEIDERQVDAWGIRVPRIAFNYSDNEFKMRNDSLGCMKEMAATAGLQIEGAGRTLPGQYAHELGGARMGFTSSDSVLNSFNQCWDAENLFVVDGSCFATSGWQNPSLTMMALAARACGFIVDAVRTGRI